MRAEPEEASSKDVETRLDIASPFLPAATGEANAPEIPKTATPTARMPKIPPTKPRKWVPQESLVGLTV